jgi:hypothetical protein
MGMVLPVDKESYVYNFYKNLNEDVKLKSNIYGDWDLDFDFENDDWVQVNGFNSIINACIIAIMTRFEELDFMPLYDEFGCRIHELVKANKSRNLKYKMELFVIDVLTDMRRVKTVNWVEIVDNVYNEKEYYRYKIIFNITCIIDEDSDGDEQEIEDTIQGEFLL